MNEHFISSYYDKRIEVYFGPDIEKYVGVVKRLLDNFLLLEVNGSLVNINVDRIVSFKEV